MVNNGNSIVNKMASGERDLPELSRREFFPVLGGLILIAGGYKPSAQPLPNEELLEPPEDRPAWQVELDNMTLEEKGVAARYKSDFQRALSETVNPHYVSTIDFDKYFADRGEYFWLDSVRRNEFWDSVLTQRFQPIYVFNDYDRQQNLYKTSIVPGNCGLIPYGYCGGLGIYAPDLPGKPLGEQNRRRFPESELQNVAQTFYLLPSNMSWERTTQEYRVPFGNGEIGKFPALAGIGSSDGKRYSVLIDVNLFSNLDIE